MKRINSAIIGCGAIYTKHADALSSCRNAELYAVCDIDSEKAASAAARYNCRYFNDYRDILSDKNIDVVHICTPHYLHAPMSINAMGAGKHVLVEKPMAITVLEAQNMINVSKATGKRLGICLQNRYNSTSIKIKEVLSSGKAGKILGGKAFVTWHRDEDYYASGNWRGTWEKEGGGVLINQAIHTLDLFQWFVGGVEWIKGSIDARLLDKVIKVEDTAEATIIFQNGVIGLFYATNCYCMDSPVEIELVCEKAVINLKGDLSIKYKNGEAELVSDSVKASGDKAYWGCGHDLLIDDFYSKLINNELFEVDGEQSIKVIDMINLIYASNKTRSYHKYTSKETTEFSG